MRRIIQSLFNISKAEPLKPATFSIYQLATPNIDNFAKYSIASVHAYAQMHGYGHTIQRSKLLDDLHINWSKIAMLENALKSEKADYVVLFDADIIIINPAMSLGSFVSMGDASTHIWMPADTPVLKRKRPNAGMIIVRNSAEGKKIIADWLHAAYHEGKHLADTHPRNQLVYWNFVMPGYKNLQTLIPRSFAAKYHWFIPVGNLKRRFLFHVTQTIGSDRASIMEKIYLKYTMNKGDLDEVQERLSKINEGVIRWQARGI